MHQIRLANQNDWKQIKFIYEAGIATQNATFETEAPQSYLQWVSKSVDSCTLVVDDGESVWGWCKLSPVSDRSVYAGVGEVSIYIHPEARGKGIGDNLLKVLIHNSEKKGFWTLTAGIFPENLPSIKLHTKNDFHEVGRRQRIGKMNGIWRDVILFERRSYTVGLE